MIVRAPKDKSHAEGSVNFAETWIIASLRNRKLFSIDEVKEAVIEKLNELNDRPFKQRIGTRRSAYLEEEKQYMLPLPSVAYEPATWLTAKVGNDYLISDGRNKYSVPSNLIGEKTDVRVTRSMVEVFYHGAQVALHRRLQTVQRDPIVKPEHMTPEHRSYLNYNTESFTEWANTVGPVTANIVRYYLTSGKAPEQGYKACATLMRLGERYTKQRLEKASERLMEYSMVPSIRNLSSILKNAQDKPAITEPIADLGKSSHGFTRGAAYFRKDGER